jgi:hypothetical protein
MDPRTMRNLVMEVLGMENPAVIQLPLQTPNTKK